MGGRFNIPPPPQERGPSEWWPALAMLATALALALLLILLTRAGCAAMAGVPGVAGEPAASASSTLRDAGYTPTQEQAPSDVVPKGHVIDTVVPDGGSESDVVVIVSSGPDQTARAPKPPRSSGGASSTTTSAAPKAPTTEPPPPERPATSTTVAAATPVPAPSETAAGDAAVASGIRDQRTQVAEIEGMLVAPGAASDSAVVADARAALEDIAAQAPVASASSCATAAQERWLASLNRALAGDLTPEAARALTAAANKAAAEVNSCTSGSSGAGTVDAAPATPIAARGEVCTPRRSDAARTAVAAFGASHDERAVFPYRVPCIVADVQPTTQVLDTQVVTTWHWGQCAEACGDVIFTVNVGTTAQRMCAPDSTDVRVRYGQKRMWYCSQGEDLDSYDVDGSGDLTYSAQSTKDLGPATLPAMLASLDLSARDWGMPIPSPKVSGAAVGKANPPGSAPRVAFAYNIMGGDGHVRLADTRGKVVGVGRTYAGFLLYDRSGTLWLSSGGWDNSGESSQGCNVRRFGDSAPAYVWSTVRSNLIRTGQVPPGTPGNNLLCGPLSPALEGGVEDEWEDLTIRMSQRGTPPIVTPAGTSGDHLTLWNGETITYTRQVDGTVTSSDVPGVGAVEGEVTFVSPGGQMLIADRGMESDPDEITLRQPDGSLRVIWPRSLGKKIAVHRQEGQTTAISRDGKWAFVLSGGWSCMACAGEVFRVSLAGNSAPVRVANEVVTLAVPPLPAKTEDG